MKSHPDLGETVALDLDDLLSSKPTIRYSPEAREALRVGNVQALEEALFPDYSHLLVARIIQEAYQEMIDSLVDLAEREGRVIDASTLRLEFDKGDRAYEVRMTGVAR